MNASRSYPIHVVTVGVIVLLLVSLVLFWGRFACKAALGFATPYANRRVRVEPSGLVPEALETQGEAASPSYVSADVDARHTAALGLTDYFTSPYSPIFQYIPGQETLCTYFDPRLGKIVQCKIYQEEDEDGREGNLWIKEPLLYVGPEGISATDDAAGGRFVEPLMEFDTASTAVIFDKALQRFFRADLKAQRIVESPADALAEMSEVVAVGRIRKNPALLGLGWTAPLRPATDEERQSRAGDLVLGGMMPTARLSKEPGEFVLVLDDTGRIYKLERETLAFAGLAGHLPAAPEYGISRDETARPRDLTAYHVEAVAFEPNNAHRGLFVATLSADGTGATLAVFDAQGEMIRRDVTMASSVRRRLLQKYGGAAGGTLDADDIAKAKTQKTFFELAWGSTLVGARYLLENLQPPVCGVASYFAAPSIEAATGHRNLLLLPHSFAGMLGRKYQAHRFQRLAILMLTISPSLLLAALLAMAVKADALAMGLSDRAVKYWTAATVAFGLSAYLTWRLTRPAETLVTCVNCGRGRRPDLEKCHRCGSAWEVPELVAPTWRVFDNHAVDPRSHPAPDAPAADAASGTTADDVQADGNVHTPPGDKES